MSNPGDLIPPDESLWRRYSPHHEFPLSTATSVLVHFFVALVVAFFGSLLFSWDTDAAPPVIANVEFGGGGGENEDAGTPSGDPTLRENVPFDPTTARPLDEVHRNNRPTARPAEPDAAFITDEDKQREAKAKGLLAELIRPGSVGRGGPGSEGGRGKGKGPGDGDGVGPGSGGKQVIGQPPSLRARRMARWELSIPYDGPEDYVDRLRNLGAILIVPDSRNAEERDVNRWKFRVYRDLGRRPAQGSLEDMVEINKINRIYFKDAHPETVGYLIQVLSLPSDSSHVWLFLPKDLEEAMLREELREAQVKTEEEVERLRIKTVFRPERQGDMWKVRVLQQYR